MAVDVDRHCYHGVLTYNIFLFFAFSLPCGKLFDLWLCSPVSSYGHVGKIPPLMGLKPNIVVRLKVQYEQVNVEKIGDGPFTLAWRSMHFLSVLQNLCSFTPT